MKLIGSNRDKNDCVVVGTYNLLALHGKPRSYLMIKFVARYLFGYRRKKGTPIENIGKMLNWFGLKTVGLEGSTLEQMEERILKNKEKLPFVHFCPRSLDGHMVVVVKKGRGINVINSHFQYNTWDKLKKAVQEGQMGWGAWEIQK